MRQKKKFGISVGTASILEIFLLLCLTTFATLSVVSSNADNNLSKKSAEYTKSYYTADNGAEDILAKIYTSAKKVEITKPDTPKVFSDRLKSNIPKDVKIKFTESASGTSISYSLPMQYKQSLDVILDVSYSSGKVNIIKKMWQVQVPLEEIKDQPGFELADPTEFALPPIG